MCILNLMPLVQPPPTVEFLVEVPSLERAANLEDNPLGILFFIDY